MQLLGWTKSYLQLNEHFKMKKRIHFFSKESRAFHPQQWWSGLFKRKIKELQIKSKSGLIWFLEKLQPQNEHSQHHSTIKPWFSFLRCLLFDNIKRICLPDLSVQQWKLFEHGKTNPHLFNAFPSSCFFSFLVPWIVTAGGTKTNSSTGFLHVIFSGVWLTGIVADQVNTMKELSVIAKDFLLKQKEVMKEKILAAKKAACKAAETAADAVEEAAEDLGETLAAE